MNRRHKAKRFMEEKKTRYLIYQAYAAHPNTNLVSSQLNGLASVFKEVCKMQ